MSNSDKKQNKAVLIIILIFIIVAILSILAFIVLNSVVTKERTKPENVIKVATDNDVNEDIKPINMISNNTSNNKNNTIKNETIKNNTTKNNTIKNNTTNQIDNFITNRVNENTITNNIENEISNINENISNTSSDNISSPQTDLGIISKSPSKASISISSLTVSGATIIIKDTNISPYTWKAGFKLQEKIDGKWNDMESSTEMQFEEEIYGLNENKEYTEILDWSNYYGSLEAGNYRIVKTVEYNNETIDFTAEFRVN